MIFVPFSTKRAILLSEALDIAGLFFRIYDSAHRQIAQALTVIELNGGHFVHVMLLK